MTLQDILRIAGIALLIGAVLLAILAAYVYRASDIRGVRADLAGKRRSDKPAPGAKTHAKEQKPRVAPPAEEQKPRVAPPAKEDESTVVLDCATSEQPRGPLSDKQPNHPQQAKTPSFEFRITHKEIVINSDKIIGE